MNITGDIKYIGVNDHRVDLFEGQYIVPNGMAYNSYIILDESIAVMDSVGDGFGEEWLGNIEKTAEGRTPDYLIVQHMEPDHSANIFTFANKYPDAKIVASAKAFAMAASSATISSAFSLMTSALIGPSTTVLISLMT